MRTKFSFLVIALFLNIQLFAQNSENEVVNTILSGYTARSFTVDPVSDQDIDLILQCGMKSPSARNSQLWKFTVIKDTALVSQTVRNATPGNVMIIVSGAEETKEGMNVDFDCALATENMFVAAQGLGLGAHIYTGPIRNVKSKLQDFDIPTGYRPIAILQIGNIENSVDAVSSASPRKSKEEVVNFGK